MDHKEMRHNVAEMTEHEMLKTIEHTLGQSGEHLTCSEVEKIERCWHVIKNIYAAMVYAKQVA